MKYSQTIEDNLKNEVIGRVIMALSLVAALMFSISIISTANAQDYGQTGVNPYSAPVVTQPTTNNSGLEVEKTQDTIKAPVRDTNNPTGQVTNEEFDGLVTGRDGR